MKGRLILAADHMIVDYYSKRASAINIMEDFASKIFPFPLQFYVLIVIEKEEGDSPNPDSIMKISLGGNVLFERPSNIAFSGGATLSKTLMNFPPFIISSPGVLSIALIQVGTEQTILQTSINILAAAPDQPPPIIHPEVTVS